MTLDLRGHFATCGKKGQKGKEGRKEMDGRDGKNHRRSQWVHWVHVTPRAGEFGPNLQWKLVSAPPPRAECAPPARPKESIYCNFLRK